MTKKVRKRTKVDRKAKRFRPTDEHFILVETALACGLQPKHIAKLVIDDRTARPISLETFKKTFTMTAEEALANITLLVGESVISKALTPGLSPVSLDAAKFFLKSRAGWTEKEKLEVEASANTGVLVVPSAMTPQEWKEQQEKKR